jgi:hypothetical protein
MTIPAGFSQRLVQPEHLAEFPVHRDLAQAAAGGDKQQEIGAQRRRPGFGLGRGKLGGQRAQAGAANGHDMAALAARPAGQRCDIGQGGAEQVRRAARRGGDQRFSTVTAGQHAPPVPGRLGRDHAHALADQRMGNASRGSPQFLFDAEAVAEDRGR